MDGRLEASVDGGAGLDSGPRARIGTEALRPIRPRDGARFLAAATAARRIAWHGFFPFLLFASRPGWRILHEEADGSLLVYLLRGREGDARLSLFLPPMPFSAVALRRVEERLRDTNGGGAPVVEWLDEGELLAVVRGGYRISLRSEEFIYDRAAVAAAAGGSFGRLRQNLAASRRNPHLAARPYAAADEAECLDLLLEWRARLSAAGIRPDGYRHTARCLREAAGVAAAGLWGDVVEVDGRIRGFAFGGAIGPEYGSVFIVITHVAYPGLSYLMRHRMMGLHPEFRYFNDSSDNGRAGIRDLKLRFRPVAMNPVYRGRKD